MPKNFNDFTQGTSLGESDQLVGFATAVAGGERKWKLSDVRNSIITGAATTIDTDNLTVSRALISNSSGKVAVSDITTTELSHLDGLSTNVQAGLVPPGAVMAFAMNSAPAGWIVADGASISTGGANAALFAAIGYTYGGSGGSFNLPDLRGYFVRGHGANTDGTVSGTFGAKQTATVVPMGDPSKTARVVVSLYNNVDDSNNTMRSLLNGEPATVNETSLKIIGYSPGTIDTAQANSMVMTTRPVNIAMLYCIKL